jgi:hypothetical protein
VATVTGHGRVPGLRTAKTVLAAVLAYVLADALDTSDSPLLAPLTALLVVQLTMYETLSIGRERVVSVVAGVLLAVGFAQLTGLTWWSLGLLIGLSLVAGRLLRLGPHLAEVPISAMLVLAVGGGAETAAWGRVTETLVGAAVGVLVNLVVAPPLYVQPAGDAVAELAERMAATAGELAAALRGPWSRSVADDALTRARGLGRDVARADRALALAEEAARLNPRGSGTRRAGPQLRATLTALEHGVVGLRTLTRSLLDRTFFVAEEQAADAWWPAVREGLADVLDAVGDALSAVAAATTATGDRDRVGERLAELARRRDLLAQQLLVDPRQDAAAWAQHGSLLDAVDRLRVEIATAARPVDVPPRSRRLPRIGRRSRG